MPNPGGLPTRLSDAIQTYVGMRGRDRIVSLRRLVDATRFIMPEFLVTERELADMIASKLVAMGCNINFDLSETDDPSTLRGRPSNAEDSAQSMGIQ